MWFDYEWLLTYLLNFERKWASCESRKVMFFSFLVGLSAGFRVVSYSYLFLAAWRHHHTHALLWIELVCLVIWDWLSICYLVTCRKWWFHVAIFSLKSFCAKLYIIFMIYQLCNIVYNLKLYLFMSLFTSIAFMLGTSIG